MPVLPGSGVMTESVFLDPVSGAEAMAALFTGPGP